MLNLNTVPNIFVASQVVDMRKGFVGLSNYIQDVLGKEPLSGSWFIFFGKRHDRIKIFYWDNIGFCLWYKLLPKGVFRPPKVTATCYSLSAHELNLLLAGIELTNSQRFTKVSAGLTQ
jgi:transposase